MSRLWFSRVALSAWIILVLPCAAAAQDTEILPSLDIEGESQQPAFVPGEIIVKLKDEPANPGAQGEIQDFEAVAFSDQIRPLGGGEFLVKLDSQLFTPQAMEDLGDRTTKVARELEKREDISSARAGRPGEVVVRPVDPGAFEAAAAAGEFESIAFDGEPRKLPGGNYALQMDVDLVSPELDNSLRERTIEVLAELKKRPDVEYAQLNYVAIHQATLPPLPPNDPDFRNQWSLFNNGSSMGESPGGINLIREWDHGRGSASVIVAVIDSGILLDHQDIQQSNVVSGFDMITKDSRAADGQPGRDPDPRDTGDGVPAGFCNGRPLVDRPDSWHGTHVAGIIGAGATNNAIGIAGMNWEVKVQPIRALGKCGGEFTDINDAIRWAAGLPVPNIPPNATPARIINLSLGVALPCSDFPATQTAINDAVARGVVVIAAAGNDAIDVAGSTPAGCQNVISVAASDARGHLADRYSNFGERIDIMAPGGEVRRDDNGDGVDDGVLSMVKGGYRRMNGTSMAAPHVAGIAALILARNPGLAPDQLLARLKQNAIPRTAAQCPRRCGSGLLNAFFLTAPEPAEVSPATTAPSALSFCKRTRPAEPAFAGRRGLDTAIHSHPKGPRVPHSETRF